MKPIFRVTIKSEMLKCLQWRMFHSWAIPTQGHSLQVLRAGGPAGEQERDVSASSGCCNKTQTGQLKQQMFTSHSFGGWKSNIRVPADSVSGEDSLPDLHMASLSTCAHMLEGERAL